ncbi:hypothetical protein FACS189452_08010 [Bacteroidia bacterium]|nr:hypothetical protein FACS189452_08010 [Bacteroidia bacterium]GHT80512.1 hypothetical protein FACS189467_2850 [Bacteroidia bacterium]
MAVMVSTRVFREQQKNYLDLAMNGSQVVLTRGIRGKKQSFIIIPIEENGLEISQALRKKIDKGLEQIQTGKTRSYSLVELRNKMGL